MNHPSTAIATAKLSEYDFIVVADASGSMSETDTPTGASRWTYMQESALAFARDLEALDGDGLGLVIFSSSGINTRDSAKVDVLKEAFASRAPRGTTPLHTALTEALALAGKSDKKDFIIVFTDGVPDDKDAVAKVIVDVSQQLETDDALTILFVQVGRDTAATNYLKQLDDALTGAKFDIVDAKTIEEAEKFPTTAALVLAAIED